MDASLFGWRFDCLVRVLIFELAKRDIGAALHERHARTRLYELPGKAIISKITIIL